MRKSVCSVLITVSSVGLILSLWACASTGSGGKKTPDRTLPQYSQQGWKNVKIVGGGMIPGIIFNTAKQGVAYVRTDMGGAYRWNPENESWIPLTDFAGIEDYGRLGIASIATDPVEPNRVIIASGTYTNSWDATASQMLVSEDYGDTFKRIDMPFKMGGNMPGRGVGERLAIDPNNNKVVYFGSFGNGLWRSRDYGNTWEEVKSFPAKGNVYDYDFTYYVDQTFKHFHGIMWVIFDPASGSSGEGSKNIYVGVADTRNTIYESNDAGATWHPLEGQPAVIFNEQEHGHLVENCPCNKYYPIRGIYSPDGSLITAWNAGFGPYSSSFQGGAIWKYTFATKKWEDISLPKHDFDPSHKTSDRGVGCVSVDWQNPQNMIAVTLNEWWPDEVIYRSTNGGKTWDPIWFLDGWPDRVNKYSLDISMAPWLNWGEQKELPEQSPKLGWCIACIVIDPFNPNVMMYGTGATIYGSKNLTEWEKGKRIKIEVMAEGIEECAILDLVSPTEGPQLISAMGDIGGFVHTNLNRAPNMIVNPKINGVNSVDYAANKPSYMIRMGGDEEWTPDGNVEVSKLGISSDSGRTWKPAEKYLAGAQAGWSGVVAVSADAKVIVWSPENMPPHWSNNEGKTWTACAGLPAKTKVVSDRVNLSKFYGIAIDSKTAYMSTDAGKTFTVMNSSFVKGDLTKCNFKAAVGMEGHLWLAGGEAGLYHSMDGGKTWTQYPDFDNVPIIGLGKAAPGADYQALYTNAKLRGKWGIYRSDDKGATWIRINDDMHQFGAADTAITGDPRVYGRVFLATNGRGIQYRDLE
ncbi:MAG: xyloglucanase [Treponema sp.]|nr:xyloglucanase [Treponema sp.]